MQADSNGAAVQAPLPETTAAAMFTAIWYNNAAVGEKLTAAFMAALQKRVPGGRSGGLWEPAT